MDKEENELNEMSTDDNMDAEEISLDELLAELEAEEGLNEAEKDDKDKDKKDDKEEEELNIEDMSEEDLKGFIESVISDMVNAGELEPGHEGMENEPGAEGAESEEMIDLGADGMDNIEGEEEEINIDELLAELELEESSHMNDEDSKIAELTASQSGAGVSNKNELVQGADKLAKKLGKAVDWVKANFSAEEIKQALANVGAAAGSALRKEEDENLAELRAEINEVNLLNAKLLYTNKIFRNKSLTETQKIKVLTAFDKATNKKEVELVYATLTESLKVSNSKTQIKESLGSASKILGGKTSSPIIENDAFARMRELAFGNQK